MFLPQVNNGLNNLEKTVNSTKDELASRIARADLLGERKRYPLQFLNIKKSRFFMSRPLVIYLPMVEMINSCESTF